ncbi:class I SAM-dependent methyltransferase [bacterium]|nr:class I SAM-dependent methyltransferase [bacterium]
MKTFTTEQNIKYWDERALKYETTGKTTLLDDNMRLLEVETVQQWLDPNDNVLEIFCGNGISTLELAGYCNSIVACDLSENMIKMAQKYLVERKPLRKNVVFEKRNVLDIDKTYSTGQFSTVVSVRGLINLPTWELQKEAILKIYALLPVRGKFIFIEGSQEGFETINKFRKKFSLSPLKEPWYDRHFNVSLLNEFMEQYFITKDERKLDIYFLVSRILYPFANLPEEADFYNICNIVARLLVPYAHAETGTTLLISKCFIKKGFHKTEK